MLQPFFAGLIGIVGSLSFLPLSVLFPFAMHRRVGRPGRATRVAMRAVEVAVGLAAVSGTIGSVHAIVEGWSEMRWFD